MSSDYLSNKLAKFPHLGQTILFFLFFKDLFTSTEALTRWCITSIYKLIRCKSYLQKEHTQVYDLTDTPYKDDDF